MTSAELALPDTTVEVLPDSEAVAATAAERIMAAAAAAIDARGHFRICLAGGSTPTAAYRLLARRADTLWAAWHVYHGDERCLPARADGRNSRVADQVWLEHVPVPRAQVHAIPAEAGAEAAAKVYEDVVRAALPFDLVLLGVGEDGHTASLFPGRALADDCLVMPVHEAPKPPPDRVSLTPTALCNCRLMMVLATGAGKADALGRWRDGEELPVAVVARGAPSLVLLDRAALPGG
jgi:6-phosphogluconolactonase